MMLTESTTLDEYTYDAVNNHVTITWRDHVFRDGVEIDAMRVARTKTYTLDMVDQLTTDVGPGFCRYADLLTSGAVYAAPQTEHI